MSYTYEEGISNLSRDNWANLNCKEKLDVLKSVENEYAQRENRQAAPVKGAYKDNSALGWYDRNTGEIFINTKYLHENPNTKNDYMTHLNTVLHEGRHAYQHQAVQGTIEHPDKNQVQQWDKNFNHYIQAEKFPQEYYNQPVEKDARNFAETQTYKVIEERSFLNNYKGNSPAYDAKQSNFYQRKETAKGLSPNPSIQFKHQDFNINHNNTGLGTTSNTVGILNEQYKNYSKPDDLNNLGNVLRDHYISKPNQNNSAQKINNPIKNTLDSKASSDGNKNKMNQKQ